MALDPITQFHSVLGRYPGNNKLWWSARATSDDPDASPAIKAGDFLPELLDKLYSGNNRTPRGHFILNAFKKDRNAVSGLTGLETEEENTRPVDVTFYSGRAWYGLNSTVFYSQIIDHKSKAGLCYQEADPTSEDISDLIASDGGVVHLPEANKILKLAPLANGVMVFAMNGVWFISGGGEGFSAVSVSVDKISSVGTKNPMSIVEVGEGIYWWSEVGIHALAQESGQFGPIPGKFGNTNIAEQTIQTFFNEIPEQCKTFAKGIYDPKNNIIQWLFSDDAEQTQRYNKILLFDVTLQAFYPWEVSVLDEDDPPRIAGVFYDTGVVSQQFQETVTSGGSNVTTISLDPVLTSVYTTNVENRPTNLTYVTTIAEDVTFSKFENRSYIDWESFDGDGTGFTSFIETGYELLEDAMRKKQIVHIFVHFRRTEDDPLGSATSCTFRTKWDWSANSFSNKWTQPIEAYRPRSFRVESTADLESGFPVVISKNKVRGSGKAIQFRFECSEPDKNFDLLGWSTAYVGNTEP